MRDPIDTEVQRGMTSFVIGCTNITRRTFANLQYLWSSGKGGSRPLTQAMMYKVSISFKLDDSSLTNYRPVSFLPQFSKVLEKLFDKKTC